MTRTDNTDERTLGRLEGLVENLSGKVETLSTNFSMIQKALARQGTLLETLPCNEHRSRISGLIAKVNRINGTTIAARASWKTLVVIGGILVAGVGIALGILSALK